MNREDITRMAREAGFVGFDGDNATLRRFAALVAAAEADRIANKSKHIIKRAEARGAAAEREACAQMVEDLNEIGHSYGLENRIRARGQG